MEGWAKVGNSSTSIVSIFTLPPGYRPPPGTIMAFEEIKEAPVVIGGPTRISEGADLSGKVVANEEKAVPLDGIAFRPGS